MATYYVDGAVGSDSNAGTSPSAGGAWATISHAAATAAAGDTVYVKSSVTYAEMPTFSTSGTAGAPITAIGYTTTPGDNGRATITGSNTRTTCLAFSGVYQYFYNFLFTSSTYSCVGFTASSANTSGFSNCRMTKGTGTASYGVDGQTSTSYTRGSCNFYLCEFDGLSSAIGVNDGIGQNTFDRCFIHDMSSHGIQTVGYSGWITANRCVIAKCGGKGFFGTNNNGRSILANCIFHKNASDGIYSGSDPIRVRHCLFTENGGFGIDNTSGANTVQSDYNGFWSNTSGAKSGMIGGGLNDVIITAGSPYVDPSPETSGNYALNALAGQGALVRGVAIPFPNSLGSAIDHLDIGAVQHQDSGGGGGGSGGGSPFVGIIGGW